MPLVTIVNCCGCSVVVVVVFLDVRRNTLDVLSFDDTTKKDPGPSAPRMCGAKLRHRNKTRHSDLPVKRFTVAAPLEQG